MNRPKISLLMIAMIATLSFHCFSQQAAAKAPEGFTPLFDGTTLKGWKGLVGSPVSRAKMSPEELSKAQAESDARMKSHWHAVDGAIEFDGEHGEQRAGNLCTDKEYGDFELFIDWKVSEGGDSGIYLRGTPQVNIWDTKYEKYKKLQNYKGSGNVYNNQKNPRHALVHADNPVGEWNTFYIRLVGQRLFVKLNGKVVADNIIMENYWERDKPLYRTGAIELQDHSSKVSFKDIYIREIPSNEANDILDSMNTKGFTSIFNGKDFKGWKGPTDEYEVKDGSIVCKPGKGGHIYTEKEYSNFIAKIEFKLPPAGNNGLAIRYPGEGNPHKAGMTEIQILDSEHPQYAKLHPTQYHGSVYGLIPAHRGYLRPTGEWNFQTVTVDESRITVELNGVVILEGDVSKLKESKDGEVYPSSAIKRGHFGFAGHNDAVPLRNIAIRELP
ncbi:MAG: DUF1080 domain-containing protein [Planctomycetaceae bacterium]|nr:DUF1080 domain-containing protein [Planctomycetaceae bacterium]